MEMTAEKKVKILDKLGLSSPEELLLLAPKGITNNLKDSEDVFEGFAYCGPAIVVNGFQKQPGKSLWEMKVEIKGTTVVVNVFGTLATIEAQWKKIFPFAKIFIKGKFERFGKRLYLTSPQYIEEEDFNKILPNYKSLPKLASNSELRGLIQQELLSKDSMSKIIHKVLSLLGENTPYRYGDIERLIWSLHAPESASEFSDAVDLAKSLNIASLLVHKDKPKIVDLNCEINLDWYNILFMMNKLPFALSPSQKEACDGIAQELESQHPMNALLSGDVGTGKTIVYLLLAVATQLAEKRVAILAPNTPLANQIATELSQFFPACPYQLITGGKKQELLGNNPVLVGTTALIGFAQKNNWKADFLVIDEQQKFSDEQKQSLTYESTNVLEATATCIPKTLGLVTHGGMSVYRLYGHAKKTIYTQIIGDNDKRYLFQKITEVVTGGDKAVLIYPQLNSATEDIKRNVVAAYNKWNFYFPDQVVLLHGGLTDTEKTQALEQAKNPDKSIIISTSIIEVGITIPKLRLGAVISSDKYGLSTLHQMRGRLARDGGEGYFFLHLPYSINDKLSDNKVKTVERLKSLVKTNNGFELAELDAENRGFGELLKDKGNQHGKTCGIFLGIHITPSDIEEYLFER